MPLILWDPLVASNNSIAAISFPTPFQEPAQILLPSACKD
uniref:Uncharacterized protein n=1 Tax=Setaria italica TaxID=4555 RepID=K3XTR6_SETIT